MSFVKQNVILKKGKKNQNRTGNQYTLKSKIEQKKIKEKNKKKEKKNKNQIRIRKSHCNDLIQSV